MEKQGIDRRTLIKRAGIAGAVAWTAPVIIGSLASPAAAITGQFKGCKKIAARNVDGVCSFFSAGGCNDPTCPCPGQSTNWDQLLNAADACLSPPTSCPPTGAGTPVFNINPGCTSCRFVLAQGRNCTPQSDVNSTNCGDCVTSSSSITNSGRTVTFNATYTHYTLWITCGC